VGIDFQPLAYNEDVYISTVPGTSASDFFCLSGIGIIYALDQDSGLERWTFSTVDGPDIWGVAYVPYVDLYVNYTSTGIHLALCR
jgi:hypothetical protein